MRTVLIGDSLTEGIPGVSYWRFLNNKRKILNKGLGGDTLLGATKRTIRMLGNKKYDDIDNYIIEIGTNDVLLPVLTKHSIVWKEIIKLKSATLGCIPCANILDFSNKYDELLSMLINHNKKVGIIGLPLIENSILKINDDMNKYNSVIKELAQKYNITYIDLESLEREMKAGNEGSYFFGKTNLGNMIDTIFTSILPFSNIVSKIRGLSVTIDCVHLNRNTAKKLASAIEQKFII